MTRHQFAAVLFAAFCFATDATAVVTPIEGTDAQHAQPNELFPNPLAVRVTDAAGQPVSGASVRWSQLPFQSLLMESLAGCFPDLGWNCLATTDATGTAVLGRMFGSAPGTYRLTVFANEGSTSLGQAVFSLTVDAAVAAPQLTVVQGAAQKAVIGTSFAQPLGVRVTREGQPVPNAVVYFSVCRKPGDLGVSCPGYPSTSSITFAAGYDGATVFTDANGYAFTSTLTAEWGVGEGTVRAYLGGTDGPSVAIPFTNTNANGGLTLDLQDMWWVGPSEAGWGLSVTQHGDKLFSLLFGYDDGGSPTWWVMSDGKWTRGVGSTFNALAAKTHATPFYAFDTNTVVEDVTGSFAIGFEGEQRGFIGGGVRSSNPNIPFSVSKWLRRFDFTTDPNAPVRGVADLWWGGPAQSGWGLSIFERPGNLFAMWFTYDDAGLPTWFVMPEGTWTSSNVFEGRLYTARGSGWVGSAYDASKFRALDVGSLRLSFLGPNAARMDYSANGRTGTLSLTRTPFGDD